MLDEKKQVYDFWNNASCGESLLLISVDYSGPHK